MPATIRDVAAACGVHLSTVSRAFSAPDLVNPETRARVLAAAAQLGYRPNKAARALITGRTTNLGLIVADITNPYFPPMIKAAQSEARRHEHNVFVADTDEDPAVEEELVRALVTQVDGILLCSPRMPDETLAALARQVPMVVVNRTASGVPAVLMQLAAGAAAAVEHLVGLGHVHLAHVAGPLGSWSAQELGRAAMQAAARTGARLTHLGPVTPDQTGGAAVARAVRTSGATGVLAYNDTVAIGLVEALRAAGVAVPGQVSVVGVDDVPAAELLGLTTVAMPSGEAGRVGVQMLLAADAAQAAPRRTLPTTLVVRGSTGPARLTSRASSLGRVPSAGPVPSESRVPSAGRGQDANRRTRGDRAAPIQLDPFVAGHRQLDPQA